MRKSVVLPQPLGPRIPTRSPASTWKLSPSRMLVPISKDLTSEVTVMSIIDQYSISVPRRMAACKTVFAIGVATESPPPPCSTKTMKA